MLATGTRWILIAGAALFVVACGPGPVEGELGVTAQAGHAWANYHWARNTASFDLPLINSTTSDWDGYVSQAVSDWNQSTKLNFIEDTSGSTSNKVRRRCKGGSGTVRICNLGYGQTGWLGIAGINIDANGHITSGYTKLNDTYFSLAFYNTDAWKQSVTCQELGHDIGLGHQDEDFDNAPLFSCMDYQDPPYEFPNAHDYEQLDTIYGHTDSYNSYDDGGSGGDGGGCNAPPGKGCNKAGGTAQAAWGKSQGRTGSGEVFVYTNPDGSQIVTAVRWADAH